MLTLLLTGPPNGHDDVLYEFWFTWAPSRPFGLRTGFNQNQIQFDSFCKLLFMALELYCLW